MDYGRRRSVVRWSRISQCAPKLRRFDAKAQRFAELHREFVSSAFLRASRRLCVKTGLAWGAASRLRALALNSGGSVPAQKNQAGLADRPDG